VSFLKVITKNCLQDASYSLDGDGNVIVGLPPPKDGNWMTARNYRLVESLVDTCMKVIVNPVLITRTDLFFLRLCQE
jgi:hypothetical protein